MVVILNFIVITVLIGLYFMKEAEVTSPNIFIKILDTIPIIAVLALFFMPYLVGNEDAQKLLKNPKVLNQAVLNDKTNWRIVEASNDKVLLLSEKDKNKFKIVEYKDVEIVTK